MGQSYYDSRSLHRPISHYIFVSFWLNGSIILIRAETERYDIVRFSKVTTKSLASGTGSEESNELGGPSSFSGVKTAKVVRLPCDSTSGNLNNKSVRKKSRGVYLPIG